MANFEVPNLYKCFMTEEVMRDPVVILTTGQVCDRTSLGQESTQAIVPLPGLKSAIHQYLQIYQNNQPEEIFESEQVQQSTSSSVTSDLTGTTQGYQQKIQDVKNQTQLVSDAYQVLQNEKEKLTSLKSQSNKFKMMADEIENLDVNGDAKSIMNCRNSLLRSWNIIGGVIQEGCQKLMNLYQVKILFEKQLACLEFKDKELVNLRQDLSKILESLEIKSIFTTEFETSSKKYRELPKINTNKFQELIKNGLVEDVCVNIESNQDQYIKIQGEVSLRNITFTNAKKGAKYVGFIIPDENTKMTFNDCKFEDIGVGVTCRQNAKCGDVVVRKTQFKYVPDCAIVIDNCNKCMIEHVQVQGCGLFGVLLDVSEGTLEDVHVQDCGWSGIYIEDVTKSLNINNSSIRNCIVYGLYINKNIISVQGTNVTFENNAPSNVYGNFSQN